MSDINSAGGRFTIWNVIAISATVAAASAGAGWTVGRTLLGDELEQYKKANEWKVPDFIRKLTELSERINISLDERARFEKAAEAAQQYKTKNDRLQKEILEAAQQYKTENDRLQKEINDKSIVLEDAQLRLKDLEGETFILNEGTSRFVIGKTLAIGVIGINPYSHTCNIQLGDKDENIAVGKTLKESRGDKNASLTLVEVGNYSIGGLYRYGCKFSITNEPVQAVIINPSKVKR